MNINNRLSRLSANEEIFNEAAPPYQQALKDSGYDHVLKFQPNIRSNNRKKETGTENVCGLIHHGPQMSSQTLVPSSSDSLVNASQEDMPCIKSLIETMSKFPTEPWTMSRKLSQDTI